MVTDLHGGIPHQWAVPGKDRLGYYVAQYDGEIAAVLDVPRRTVTQRISDGLEQLRGTLTKAGYVVIEARHGQDALKLAARDTPDLIILDMGMPGMGGVGFLDRITNPDGSTLVPVLVGNADPESVARVLRECWGGPETLFVISTDLSHYHSYDEARRIDGATLGAAGGAVLPTLEATSAAAANRAESPVTSSRATASIATCWPTRSNWC